MLLDHIRITFLLFAIKQAIALQPADLWEDMTIAATDNILSNIFYNEETLNEAYEFEEKQGSFKDESYRISCLGYVAGVEFAKKIRVDYKTRDFLVPYRVDRAKNLSCFSINTSSTPKQIMKEISFTKSVVLPAPLKIHTSVYELIENGGMSNFPLANHCIRIHHAGLSKAAITAFLNETVKGYNGTHFDTFFWSQPQLPNARLRGETLEQSPSLARSLAWKGAKARLSALAPAPAPAQTPYLWPISLFWQPTSGAAPSDPCGFEQGFAERSFSGSDKDNLVFTTDRLLASNDSQLVAACVAHLASAFAQVPQVRLIAFAGLPAPFNVRARPLEIAGTLSLESSAENDYFADLKGQNVLVSIADTGVDESSCFFLDADRGLVERGSLSSPILDLSRRKIVQYSFVDGDGDGGDEAGGHGSHVAGTLAGNTDRGGLSAYNGVAAEARIIVIDCAAGPGGGLYPPSPADMYSNSLQAGGSIHSNSWGSQFSSGGYYTNQDTDQFLYDHPTFIVFFAAGNFGSSGVGSVSMESSAKNVVSVASSDTTFNSNSIDHMSYYSSMGPTFDGRIKPDITAPGNAIESANSAAGAGSCETTAKSGTSMASPAAAAAAALVSQFFSDDRFWAASCDVSYFNCKAFIPSGVLLKAALLHSGQQMATRGAAPDSVQGRYCHTDDSLLTYTTSTTLYLSIYRSLALPRLRARAPAGSAACRRGRRLQAVHRGSDGDRVRRVSAAKQPATLTDSTALLPAAASEIQYNIAVGGAGPLKATLAWYDPPSVDGSAAQLLLHDLDLTATSPDGTVHYGNGGSGRDSVNNNEQVLVSQPAEGMWTFRVRAGQLVYASSQQYSIVITFAAAAAQADDGHDDDYGQRVAMEEALSPLGKAAYPHAEARTDE